MNRIITVRLPIIIISLLFLFIGCSTMPGLKKTTTPNNGSLLKKRVLVAPVNVEAEMDQEGILQINTTLHQLLQNNGHFILRRPDESGLSHINKESFQFGAALTPVLADELKAQRIDILLTSVLIPLDIVTEKKGFLCFKKEKSEVVVHMMMNALDITTGTVSASYLESEVIKLPTVIPEGQETQVNIENTVLESTLSSILNNLVQKTADDLKSKPWMGRLVLTSNRGLIINGGKDIGVSNGSVFEVFKQGEPIQNFRGEEQLTLGPKLGEIQAVEVMPDYSIVAPLSGKGFVSGQVIRFKRP